MFHNVIIKKAQQNVLLVVLLNSELYYNAFCNHILFTVIARQCHYMTITSKLVLLNFLFDLFVYLVNFFNNVLCIQNAHELHIKICLINIVYCIFCICSGVYPVSLF